MPPKNRNRNSHNGYNETYYLKNVSENIKNNLSPADILINKYNNQWKKTIDPIYKELIF